MGMAFCLSENSYFGLQGVPTLVSYCSLTCLICSQGSQMRPIDSHWLTWTFLDDDLPQSLQTVVIEVTLWVVEDAKWHPWLCWRCVLSCGEGKKIPSHKRNSICNTPSKSTSLWICSFPNYILESFWGFAQVTIWNDPGSTASLCLSSLLSLFTALVFLCALAGLELSP